MAVHYKLVKNNVKSGKNYGKWYARTVVQGTVSMEEIEQLIEKSCSAKASDVRMVIRELYEAVRHYMQAGYAVDLGDMGKMHLAVRGVCVDDPKEFRADKHISGVETNYTAAGHRYPAHMGKLAGRIHRGFADGCKVTKATRYKK